MVIPTMDNNGTTSAYSPDYERNVEEHNKKVLSKGKKPGMELPSKVLFHLAPERFEDEMWEQYKERRSENNAYIKKYLKQGNSWKRPFGG